MTGAVKSRAEGINVGKRNVHCEHCLLQTFIAQKLKCSLPS